MTQNINQFAQTPEVGDIDLPRQGTVISAMVNVGASATLVNGQPVKLANVAGRHVPFVIPLAANTDATFGFVVRNLKDVNFVDGDSLEVAAGGSIMFMTAGGAIAPQAKVEVVYTTNKVIAAAGTNPRVGYALDKATADGDIIRVMITTPADVLAV